MRKVVSAQDYSALVHTIRDERAALEDAMTEALLISLSDGRAIRLAKYAPTDHEGQRVRIEKREFRSPSEEIAALTADLKKTEPGLSDDQARQRVLADHPELYPSHIAAQRAGRGNPPLMTKAAPLSYEQVLAEADALVAKTAGWTRRDALMALVQQYPQESVFYEAYRRWHGSPEALRAHYGLDKAQG